MKNITYLILGIFFGIVMLKSEAASWFRIYEMFQFKSFHMYGIIGSALISGIIFIQIIKRFKIKTFNGDQIHFIDKKKSIVRYLLGGIMYLNGINCNFRH